MSRRVKLLIISLAVVVVIFVVMSLLTVVVAPGRVAVIYDPIAGTISSPRVGPTIILKAPWQGVIQDLYTIEYVSLTNEPHADHPPIVVLTRDGVSVTVEVTFTYEIDPGRFDILVKNYPRLDYESSRLVPLITQVVRDVVSRYTTEETITNRSQIAVEIDRAFRELVRNDPTLVAIKLHDVVLRGIVLPPTVSRAIEEKIASLQAMLAAEYQRQREIILANATAASQIIRAQGEAEAFKVRAATLAKVLEDLRKIDPELARLYLFLEYLSRLQNATIVISPSSPIPTIPIESK